MNFHVYCKYKNSLFSKLSLHAMTLDSQLDTPNSVKESETINANYNYKCIIKIKIYYILIQT